MCAPLLSAFSAAPHPVASLALHIAACDPLLFLILLVFFLSPQDRPANTWRTNLEIVTIRFFSIIIFQFFQFHSLSLNFKLNSRLRNLSKKVPLLTNRESERSSNSKTSHWLLIRKFLTWFTANSSLVICKFFFGYRQMFGSIIRLVLFA